MSQIQSESRNQVRFTSLEMEVDKDSRARAIDTFVDEVVMKDERLAESLKAKYLGRPSYPAAALLKLYIYGYFYNIRSSRNLARATKVNLEVKWLMGDLQPDFRTISDFRKNHSDDIVYIMSVFSTFFKGTQITEDGKQAFCGFKSVDGTKIRASQSKDGVYTASKIDDRIENSEARLAQYWGYLEDLDRSEAEGNDESEMLPSRETIEKNIEFYKKHTEELIAKRAIIEKTGEQYSETDPDARLMKSHYGNFTPSYNIQTVVDSNSHMIESFLATNNTTDHGLLYESVKDLEDVKEIVADNGYNQKGDLAKCLENGIIPNVFPDTKRDENGAKVAGTTIEIEFPYEKNEVSEEDKASEDPETITKCLHAGIVPNIYKGRLTVDENPVEDEKVFEEPEISAEDDLPEDEMIALAAQGYFVRNISRDLVICPMGVKLRKKSNKGKGVVRYCNKLRCGKCTNKCFKASKTTKWKEVDFYPGQRVKPARPGVPKPPSAKRRKAEVVKVVKMTFHPDLEKLSQRKCLSEHPFGTIKRFMHGDHFLLRTLEKVKGEAALMCLGYNLKRLFSLVSVQGAIALMKG